MGVQTYGRFIANVEHSGQARSDLGRQPDTLGLAP